jgi:hypothetical protein
MPEPGFDTIVPRGCRIEAHQLCKIAVENVSHSFRNHAITLYHPLLPCLLGIDYKTCMPAKRHSSLIPLSHDHHHGLVLAFRLEANISEAEAARIGTEIARLTNRLP